MKKYGAIFIVSILAILVNAILLTREFWLSIPWWIYLLLVGGILIGFAIKNNMLVHVGDDYFDYMEED